MKLNRQYTKTKLRRRFAEFLIIILILHFLVYFGFGRFVFAEGMLSQGEYEGERWYIEFSGNIGDGIDPLDIIISNPESYPNILKSENIGKDVVYVYRDRGITLAIWAPHSEFMYLLDLKNDFYIKFYINTLVFSVLSSIIAFSIIFFIYSKRQQFQIINKIFK